MTPKDYLSRYKKIEKELFALEEEQRAIRKRMYSLQACSYDDTPQSPNKSTQAKFEGLVDKIIDIEDRVIYHYDELLSTLNDISQIIEAVSDDTYRTLLKLRYICGKTWEQIAVDMGYSYIHVVKNLHPKALKSIQK